ncbi:hypothetical protein ASPZODRAFT_60375 [Penicilliopsis zonata CBS 506.65]|uniref:Chitin-binding type-4 domain-containing protein n=1 Tax=Penicilliopsis zonata CBS 506.65 TaxID=1073090 RepID=A0A1L9SP27_9EURO|nr:hypothetical protein ASPZODRAFT_60375 [Penicilliopsis zonata CBS 506.65]OJJ48958.1 hypothetical protein ASPZODRAFT_60375 [Penicilliopsis zonata CBS 506.65]
MITPLAAVAAMLAISAVDAHMIMSRPYPYGQSTLNNSPLDADGSDFPCKLRGSTTYEAPSESNDFEIGVSQLLSFIGSATHGGGSCQISLTTDMEPSKSSSWSVIKSFEGGCPANVDGNLSGGAETPDPYTFNFTIPAGISPGNYTLAWTWFNRIGNREMYMNCAPITVYSGSSSSASPSKRAVSNTAKKADTVEKRTTYPTMFVANINGCTTTEGYDIRFPDPGDVVEFDGEPSNLQASGAAACTGVSTPWGGSSATAASGASSSTAAAVAPAAVTSAVGGGGTEIAVTSSVATAASEPTSTSAAWEEPSSVPSQTAAVITSASTPTSSSSASSSSSSSTSSGVLTGSCSTEGEWNCIEGTSFQRCASGEWSAVEEMAAGTECTTGQSDELSVSAVAVASAAVKARSTPRFLHRRRESHGHRS